MAVKVEVISEAKEVVESVGGNTVIEVVKGTSSPISTVGNGAAVEVVRGGGTVVGVTYGEGLPASGYEGQIFIDIS